MSRDNKHHKGKTSFELKNFPKSLIAPIAIVTDVKKLYLRGLKRCVYG